MRSGRAELVRDYDRRALEGEWRRLEAAADCSFFLSWTWISTWLDSVAYRPALVRVRAGDEIVALGLLGRSRTRWFGAARLHLHETGDADMDRIAIEYNGLLAAPGWAGKSLQALLAELATKPDSFWRELQLPGIAASTLAQIGQTGLVAHVYRQSPSYMVELARLRQRDGGLLDGISANMRAQLTRALRLAEAGGMLALQRPASAEQALEFFEGLKALDRWAARGQQGAFASAARNAFHRRLILRGHAAGEVELLEARAGGAVLGYLYQFRYRGRILAYQAGYRPGPDNRHHPGLVMHYLAMEAAKAQGMTVYDFLAGEARYKRSLGKPGETFIWLRLQKPGMRATAELILRKLARSAKERI